jgi:hypothetical protein
MIENQENAASCTCLCRAVEKQKQLPRARSQVNVYMRRGERMARGARARALARARAFARAVLVVLVAAGGGLADATCVVGFTGTPCVMCAAGKFKNFVGTESCYLCPWGKYSWAGLSACKDCIPGTFADEQGMSGCKICPAGKFMSDSRAADCNLCQKGYFSANDGAIERVLFIGTQFSILYTSMYSPAEAATPRA